MSAADAVLTKAIQAKLESSGLDWIRLETLHFVRADKHVTVTIQLDGDPGPVTVDLTYTVSPDFTTLSIASIQASRRWVTESLRLALAKTSGTIPLPGGLKGLALRVLL